MKLRGIWSSGLIVGSGLGAGVGARVGHGVSGVGAGVGAAVGAGVGAGVGMAVGGVSGDGVGGDGIVPSMKLLGRAPPAAAPAPAPPPSPPSLPLAMARMKLFCCSVQRWCVAAELVLPSAQCAHVAGKGCNRKYFPSGHGARLGDDGAAGPATAPSKITARSKITAEPIPVSPCSLLSWKDTR